MEPRCRFARGFILILNKIFSINNQIKYSQYETKFNILNTADFLFQFYEIEEVSIGPVGEALPPSCGGTTKPTRRRPSRCPRRRSSRSPSRSAPAARGTRPPWTPRGLCGSRAQGLKARPHAIGGGSTRQLAILQARRGGVSFKHMGNDA